MNATKELKIDDQIQTCAGRSMQSPAKVQPADLTWLFRQIQSFDQTASTAESWLPPSSWYTAPEVYWLEQQTVFRNNWLLAARSDQVGNPGQFVAGNIAGEPYVVVRSEDGQLKAFYNVCRHHAAEVALGEGCLEKFQCRYHGWTYALDGKLTGAPGLGVVKGFDLEHFGLVPMHVQEWGSLVFICRGERPRDLHQDLGALKSLLGETNFASLKFVERRSYMVNCNWKVFVDNYLDGGYHVQHLHKGLSDQLDLTTYRTEIFARYSVQSTGGKVTSDDQRADAEPAHGTDFAERLGEQAVYAWLYPNLMINRYGSIMDTNWVLPIGHDRTMVVFDFYFADTEPTQQKEFIERCIAASEVVQSEDVDICESVQRGLWSSSYDKGRYGQREGGEHHFHRLLAADCQSFVTA